MVEGLGLEISDRELRILEQLEENIRHGRTPQQAAEAMSLIVLDDDLVARVVQIREQIVREVRRVGPVIDPADAPEPWYTGPTQGDRFWPALESHLRADPRWEDAVQSLDETSTHVVARLPDPRLPRMSGRGLVLGYVQSGKTANFTATIAKAADAGYRLFIVLSGVHNALRRQTQIRLEDHLYELNRAKWLPLTTENQDFGRPLKAVPLLAQPDLRVLAVVKKNVSRLTNLVNWLTGANDHGALDNCPILLIDDEADQASPNAAGNPELDRTKINELIVKLLAFPRVAYVGYTATPFANVFINPSESQDLYPSSFIYALPAPPAYFGAEKLFGAEVAEDEEDETSTPHDMIREVPEDEAVLHTPNRGVVNPEVTESLAAALRWFLLATAARRTRDGKSRHSSMLIHTTMRVDPQNAYCPVIKEHVAHLARQWHEGETREWREQWDAECVREPAGRHGLEPVSFAELSTAMPQVLTEATVVVDNNSSTNRLVYSDDPATVIVVGGNTLSRGLTLEGLVCSFFLRNSTTFDSLLQMGRWFGYRPNYSDLPRIWTTAQIAADYQFLSEIESGMRDQIQRLAFEGATPLDLPVRIRTHPRLQITARNKMYFAVPGAVSFGGHRPQTTYFHHLDAGVISKNRIAAREFLATAVGAGASVQQGDTRTIIRDVHAGRVLTLLERFSFHPDTQLHGDAVRSYISDQLEHGALQTWNVAVISRRARGAAEEAMDLSLPTPFPLLVRSKKTTRANLSPNTADIGILMSRPDRIADLIEAGLPDPGVDALRMKARTESGRALLALYPIDRNSSPKAGAKHRESLGAIDHLLGLAIAFPDAAPGTESSGYMQVAPHLLEAARERVYIPDIQDEDGTESYLDNEGNRDDVDLTDA